MSGPSALARGCLLEASVCLLRALSGIAAVALSTMEYEPPTPTQNI